MNPGATRSRAAILCFGGWGLQTMLHLAPRLRAAQEQRVAIGIDGPDLTRITRLAALMPADKLDQQGDLALHLLALRDDRLPPFYLERLLNRLERSNWQGDHVGDRQGPPADEQPMPADIFDGDSGVAQRRASLLLDAARDTLLPLRWQETDRSRSSQQASAAQDPTKAGRKGLPWPFKRSDKAATGADTRRQDAQSRSSDLPAAFLDPPGRRHAFRAALQTGDRIAHLFASNIIDPIRADTHAPGDPFVQTTLYVIAPLYEPLTSALIWPTIAHQLHYLGQRHIAQVVGIFAAGSYATDSSRMIEDASCYATMAELEALTGVRDANLTQFMSLLREESSEGVTLPDEWLGRPLFDRIYLVDREKSNQGLAGNSYELSVLVGNALQALIAADGAAYIDEQVGIDLRNASKRPYSLLGAAADYVPLDYIFHAAQEHEGKRLVQERILSQVGPDAPPVAAHSGWQEPTAGPAAVAAPMATLQELGATSQQVLIQLAEQMPDLFDELNPQSIQQLSAHPDYVLTTAMARKLRGLNPVRWQTAFDKHFQGVLTQFEEGIGAGALDTAWGLAALREDGLPRNPGDNRFLPTISRQMRSYLLSLLSAQPSGLVQARLQLQHWLAELALERRALTIDSFDTRATVGRDSGKHRPAHDAARARQDKRPQALGANHIERHLELRDWRARYLRTLADQPSLFGSLTRALFLLGGVLLLTLLYAFASRQAFSSDIIFDMINDEANNATFAGLIMGAFLGATVSYRARLRRVQRLRRERVRLACLELTTRLQDSVRGGLGRVYDHLEEMLRQMDHVLDETCESLQAWSVSASMPPLPPEEGIDSHLYRPHLNPQLWERCRSFMRSREDAEGRQGEERLREIWTSPQRRQQVAALFTGETGVGGAAQPGAGATRRPLAQALSAYVRDCARAAVAGALDDETDMARRDFVRTLAQEYNLEHLLWREASSSQEVASLYPDGEFTPVSTATLRYLEGMWNAAKPSANYDVSDRLAAYGLPVEFAAVSGDADSDLTDSVMQGLRIPRLLTGDSFQISCVRTLHGLELKDLGSMARYMAELGRLNYASRQQILLTEAAYAELYNQRDARAGRP